MGLFDNLLRDRNTRKAQEQAADSQDQPSSELVQDQAPSEALEAEKNVDNLVQEEDVPDLSDAVQEAQKAQEANPVEDSASFKPIKKYDQKDRVTHVVGETRVVAIINQKGGVGKMPAPPEWGRRFLKKVGDFSGNYAASFRAASVAQPSTNAVTTASQVPVPAA